MHLYQFSQSIFRTNHLNTHQLHPHEKEDPFAKNELAMLNTTNPISTYLKFRASLNTFLPNIKFTPITKNTVQNK